MNKEDKKNGDGDDQKQEKTPVLHTANRVVASCFGNEKVERERKHAKNATGDDDPTGNV